MIQTFAQTTNVAMCTYVSMYISMYVYTYSLAYHMMMVWETWTRDKMKIDV